MTLTTPDLITRLQARHPQTEGQWATVVEFQGIDFLAVGTWPSTQFVVHGYEIKASRSDWLRELKSPNKCEPGKAMVDHWWLAAPAGVAKEEEIPEDWGYLLVDERGTREVKKAPALRATTPKSNFASGAQGRMIFDRRRAERKAFAMLARRFAYSEADRLALSALDQVMDTQDALDAAALSTGRWTKSQKISKAEWEERRRKVETARGTGKKRKRAPRQEYVGW